MMMFQYGTLYKILGSTIINECNIYGVPKGVVKDDRTLTALGGKTVLWNRRLGIS